MPHTSYNNGASTAQFVTNTLISGNIRAMSVTGITTASNTKASQAALALATLLVQMTPEVTTSTAATIPTAPATWNNIGWQMDTNAIQYGDPGTTSGNTVSVPINWTSSTAGSVTFTVILFVGGVEIGRGSLVAATTTSAAAYTVSVAITSGKSIPANGKIQMSIYALLPTNASLGAITYTLNYGNTATGTQIGVVQYTIQAVKAITESLTTTDSPTRQIIANRSISDTVTTSDTPTQSSNHPRSTTETLTTSDIVSRIAAHVNIIVENLTTLDTPTRRYTGSRSIADTMTTSDTPARAIIYGRNISEYPAGVTPDYPVQFPTKAIAGQVINHETGITVSGATVKLYRDSDDKLVQTTTSTTGGAFSFPRDTYDSYTYHYTADYTISSVQYHGISDRNLVPS